MLVPLYCAVSVWLPGGSRVISIAVPSDFLTCTIASGWVSLKKVTVPALTGPAQVSPATKHVLEVMVTTCPTSTLFGFTVRVVMVGNWAAALEPLTQTINARQMAAVFQKLLKHFGGVPGRRGVREIASANLRMSDGFDLGPCFPPLIIRARGKSLLPGQSRASALFA